MPVLLKVQKVCVLGILLLLIIACTKNDYQIQNLNNNKIDVIGHGGMGISHVLPFNSYPSFEKCLELNTQGIEIDIQLTSDNQLVAYHDEDLSESTNCAGFVNSKKESEIQSCNYKFSVSKDNSLVTLNELFNRISNKRSHHYFFDCKLYTDKKEEAYLKKFAESISSFVKEQQLYNRVFVESTDTVFLRKLHEVDSDLQLFLYANSISEAVSISNYIPLLGVTISNDIVTKEDIILAHENGLFVAVFNTQTKKENTEAIVKNPDFIQTDKVKYLSGLLN